MPANIEDILRTYSTLKTQRMPWESTWQVIAETCLPAFSDIQSYIVPGNTRTHRVFDTTGMQGLNLLASHLAGAVTNFQTRWFELRMSHDPLNELKPVTLWLDACAKTMQDKLSATTTPQAFHEHYLQFAGFSTGTMFVDEAPIGLPSGYAGLITRSLPIATYVMAEDAVGMVDTLYRELELSPRQAVQHFGLEALPDDTKVSLNHADLAHTPGPYLQCVYPRQERDPRYENQANMPFASVYVDVKHKAIVSEGGYRWFPYMASRWQKLRTWSPYGFGPAHIALPEILTLNRMDKDILTALQMHILPPWWTDDPDATGRVLLLPGYVNSIAKGSSMQAMTAPGRFDIGKLGMEERRQRIKQIFYVDQLMALPPPDTTGKMTAFEVAQRVGQMQQLMGPAFMRLLSELLNPFIDITFGTMLERDELPEPPDIVYIASMQGQGKITVDYQGPLARAQRGDEITAIEGTLAIAERYFAPTQDVSVYDNIDIDEAIRRSGKVYGIPPSVLRDQAEVAKLRQERAQAQQEAQRGEAIREDVKALGPASQMVKALMPAQPQENAA